MMMVWVMVIAMPLQGMAAPLMLFCGPTHGRMMQGVVPPQAATMPAHDHMHGHDDSVAASHHDGSTPAAQHGQSSCSACAACCVMLAMPARFEVPAQSGSRHRPPPLVTVPVPSHLPDGLDRPPRSRLA